MTPNSSSAQVLTQTPTPGVADSRLKLTPLSAGFGVKACGIDLSKDLDLAEIGLIREAWQQHGVLLIPGQQLGELEQVRFGECFGELAHTQGDYAISKSHPAIMYVTNEKADGEYVGALPDGEMYFHSDMCYVERPSMSTILYAMNIPSVGGNTLFANMYQAYDTLPEATKQRLACLRAVNSYDPGTKAPMAATRTQSASSKNARSFAQPLVCTHPVTGKKALYLNRLMTEYIVGMPREESNQLLESLFAHQEQTQFIYEHHWTLGDLVMWDNRCVLHARRDFDARELRKMRRITVKGDRIA